MLKNSAQQCEREHVISTSLVPCLPSAVSSELNIRGSSYFLLITAASSAWKGPLRPRTQPRPAPRLSPPPADQSPKSPWVQLTSCSAHLHPCWGVLGQHPLLVSFPARQLPASSPVQLLHPRKTRANPVSGLNQEIQKFHIKGQPRWAAQQQVENRAISHPEILAGVGGASRGRETMKTPFHLSLGGFLFPSPFQRAPQKPFFSEGEKYYSWTFTSCLTCDGKNSESCPFAMDKNSSAVFKSLSEHKRRFVISGYP